MTLSESFDDLDPIESQFFTYGSDQCSESAVPLQDRLGIDAANQGKEALDSWQENLLPMPCIAAEDSLAVLRAELEKAHTFLQQQQQTVDALEGQLTNRDLQIHRLQSELVEVQQNCEQQSTKIVESDGICRGLKTQLRRQQQRVLQYRNLLNEHLSKTDSPLSAQEPIWFSSDGASKHKTFSTGSNGAASAASKSSSVSAWSAPPSVGLTGPLACYRELATIRMNSAQGEANLYRDGAAGSHRLAMSTVSAEPTSTAQNRETNQDRVELPSFSSAKFL